MNSPVQATQYQAEPVIEKIADFITSPVEAAQFPASTLRFRNDRHARTIGLDGLDDSAWIAHFARFEPLPDNLPQALALAYHGHQFRVYNPEIGDGRGFLFAQMRDSAGRVLDLGTKGSGQTPWSRDGDGRLTLKGAVREILATEMLEALGVDTSKTFSVVETGEALWRGDEPSPARSAVLVRMSHSHIRFGSFQRLTTLDKPDEMARLVRYCLEHYYPGALDAQADDGVNDSEAPENDAALLLGLVVEKMAQLAASYMVAGFVHGVLNTDNMNITGESFDYGPWRFSQYWSPGFTAAYFDHEGLYCFARQPEAIHWNLGQLAVSLRLLSEAEPLIRQLQRFGPLYQQAITEKFCQRMGLRPKGVEQDRELVQAAELLMLQDRYPIDHFFFDFKGGRIPKWQDVEAFCHAHKVQAGEESAAELQSPEYRQAAELRYETLAERLADYTTVRTREHDYWQGDSPCSMLIDEVENIWAAIAENDDWQAFADKIDKIRIMGEAMASDQVANTVP